MRAKHRYSLVKDQLERMGIEPIASTLQESIAPLEHVSP